MYMEELIQIVREDYLDDVADTDDDSDLRWSDSFLRRALAKAEREACRRTDLLFDDSTSTVTQITLATDTDSYTYNNKITRIDSVIYDDEPLDQKTEAELVEEHGEGWRTDTGEPTAYVVRGGKIRFYPTPTSSESGDIVYLEVFRLPLVPFTTSPEIPEEHHEDLCPYAAYLAWKRRDEDTFDPGKASEMLAEFTATFGTLDDAAIRRHRLEQPKNTQIKSPRYF
jgi:hypothetical protein